MFARDGHICHLCGQDGADTIDHVVAGDNHELTNLAPAHDKVWPHCHRRKTSAEGNAKRLRETRIPERHPGLL